jgi:hypothetical protein
MRPLAAGAIIHYHYVEFPGFQDSPNFSESSQAFAQAAAKFFQEKRLAFLRFPFPSRN